MGGPQARGREEALMNKVCVKFKAGRLGKTSEGKPVKKVHVLLFSLLHNGLHPLKPTIQSQWHS